LRGATVRPAGHKENIISWKRRAFVAGGIAGARFAVKAFEPSLMKRSALDQGLISGGSFLTGFVSGAATSVVVSVVPFLRGGLIVRAVGTAATAAASIRAASDDGGDASEGAAWTEIGAEVISAAALPAVGSRPDKGNGSLSRFVTVVAVGSSAAFETAELLDARQDRADAKYLATAVGVGVGANAAVFAIAGTVVGIGKAAYRFVPGPRPARALAGAIGMAAAAIGVKVGAKAALRRVIGRLAAGNRATEIAYATPPQLASVSGSRFSLVPYESLGLQGRRLVSEVTTAADIEDVMGEAPRAEPVRAYVGVGSAADENDRVELAIQELRRAGGFDRSVIIAACPAGTGYVNYIAAEAAELMARGDVAIVAVQFGEVPSIFSINRLGDAARLYEKLISRLREEVDALGRDIRLAAYGESLGSIASQLGVAKASEGHDGLIVDDALWVGTPVGSPLFVELTANGVPVFDHPDDYRKYLADGNAVPDVFFLNHDNDPVTKFTGEVAYRQPAWLATSDRGRGIDPAQRWLPGISFWQVLFDTKNAATVIPGDFLSTGHDYRADLATFVRAAYGFDDVSDDQMAAIEQRLRDSEVARAKAIAEGKVQTA